MKRQQGFGLIEVLVAMSLLSVATLAIFKWFGMQKSSDANVAIAMKNLQDQRILERAIWTKNFNANVRQDSQALPNCVLMDITASSPNSDSNTFRQMIRLTSDSAICAAIEEDDYDDWIGNSVWAEIKQLSNNDCTFNNFSSQILTANCSGPISRYADNINSLTNKSDFLVMLWDNNNNSTTCALANTATPASGSTGGPLQLTMSSACTINVSTANSAAVRMPKYFIHLLGKFEREDGNGKRIFRDDGYKRFYY